MSQNRTERHQKFNDEQMYSFHFSLNIREYDTWLLLGTKLESTGKYVFKSIHLHKPSIAHLLNKSSLYIIIFNKISTIDISITINYLTFRYRTTCLHTSELRLYTGSFVNPDGNVPASTIHWPNIGTMLNHRLRRWFNIEPTLGQCIVFARTCVHVPFTCLSSVMCHKSNCYIYSAEHSSVTAELWSCIDVDVCDPSRQRVNISSHTLITI